MMRPPSIGIVVPTRNRRDILINLLHSLSRQANVTVQLVIVDEGSTDGTLEFLASSAIPNMNVIHHPTPRGVSAARNAGLALIDTEYVGFIDDDDLWSPDRSADAIDAITKSTDGAAWACCGSATINARKRIIGLQRPPAARDVPQALYRENALPGGGSAVIARTDLVRAAGGFSDDFTDLADWDLWLRMIRLSPVAVVDAYQIAYRFDFHIQSNTRVARSTDELARLRIKHHFGHLDHVDYDEGKWARWISRNYLRARDRAGMSRILWQEARRGHRPFDACRAMAHRLLPVEVQIQIIAIMHRASMPRWKPEVKEIERWLRDDDDPAIVVAT